jgi:hypothetical protein
MLSIFKIKLNNSNKSKVISLDKKDKGEKLGLITHYPPANKE